ncbi:hypothetical protein BDR07DRAFT_1430548 [Suillus spraguei]|nr:hypothetical protein BDR07DRAFT_1430548 [Suillus spraguei]
MHLRILDVLPYLRLNFICLSFVEVRCLLFGNGYTHPIRHFAVTTHLFSLGFSLIHDHKLVPGQRPDRWHCSWPWLGEYIKPLPQQVGRSQASCSGVLHFRGAIYINCYAMSAVIKMFTSIFCSQTSHARAPKCTFCAGRSLQLYFGSISPNHCAIYAAVVFKNRETVSAACHSVFQSR